MPAPSAAELPATVLPVIATVAPSALMTPPASTAELPEIVVPVIVTWALALAAMPPPLPAAVLPVITQSARVRCSSWLKTPAPFMALPAVRVRPEMETSMKSTPPSSTLTTREAPLPLTVITAAPGPWTSRKSVTASSPVVRVIVPVSPAWKSMTSAPAAALASSTAWRRLSAPESFRFLTVKVAAWAGDAAMTTPSVRAAPEARVAWRTAFRRAGRSCCVSMPDIHFSSGRRQPVLVAYVLSGGAEYSAARWVPLSWHRHGLPRRLRGVLHRPLDLLSHPGHAGRQAGWGPLRPALGRQPLPGVRPARAARGLRPPPAVRGDVRRNHGARPGVPGRA